jgi:spectinomycin phosphotransferase
MLEPPDLPDEQIVACLRESYGVDAAAITFLPLGADVNSAVYRVAARGGAAYFLKLRGGDCDELIVALPHLLRAQGIGAIIAPVPTGDGQLWGRVGRFRAMLYPFVEGRSGFSARLSDRHWVELGAALRRIHTATLPLALRRQIPRETYAPHWRERVREFQARAEGTAYAEPVAARLAAFMRAQRDVIDDLVGRAEQLAGELLARPPAAVLCHADAHAGNLLVGDSGELYLVDWDTPILAPPERDLMFVGAGLGVADTAEQRALFYQGYGQHEPDPIALAYYRYERIVEDIAAFCEQLLLSDAGGADREQALGYLVGSFQPDEVVARAYALDTLVYPRSFGR